MVLTTFAFYTLIRIPVPFFLAQGTPRLAFIDSLRQVITGLAQTPFVTIISQLGYAIAVATILFMAYETFARGAEPSEFGMGVLKFLVGLLLIFKFKDFFLLLLGSTESLSYSIMGSDSGFQRVM